MMEILFRIAGVMLSLGMLAMIFVMISAGRQGPLYGRPVWRWMCVIITQIITMYWCMMAASKHPFYQYNSDFNYLAVIWISICLGVSLFINFWKDKRYKYTAMTISILNYLLFTFVTIY